MIDLLERAFSEAAKLPAKEQEQLARRWLAELADEQAWDRAFADSQDQLARLAAEAIAEDNAERTKPLNPDRP